jgi:ribosome-associated protein
MPHIELNAFVKLQGFAPTGGQAKIVIRSGNVHVNGQVETRNKRKLVLGDKVRINGRDFVVEASVLSQD